MEPCLDDIFYKYSVTKLSSKNYAKNLTKLINFLVVKGRFLEARFYLDQLEKTHNGNIISIRLGYKLAIALFDNKKVVKYDSLLLERKNYFELEWYRLQYYYSVNNIPEIIKSTEYLLSKKKLEQEYIQTILEAVWNIRDYRLALIVHKYIIKNRMRLAPQMEKVIRDIVLEKLRDSLAKYKNV
ncbi:hypothetical protein ABTA53_18065 [Acinetobacter baumannii]|uniref:hypothetical protein n=1 Tax=Acinetobacter TaxID=469 RepID=UPI001EEFFFFE|nr:hypothetical protein [Acinetobacter baumannii]EJB8481806.1 hypothetical protein [Acinetobacter baumannii]EKU3412637.1 hypothetical protein [Acinetobacter baumannii]MCG6642013.1 hypothetical protein [Acinetobacter baumannii]MCL6694243.1 hypothetical protein [Acinetobacter baumannii]MCT9560697.1 hypothetical protein [Acinetobacter baumannii]